jgi:signal transduction histidine kinase/ligand-binding sensor domain-containing protein/CheY-like chemotaxis protein
MASKILMKTDFGKIAFILFLFIASYTFISAQGLQVDFRTFTTQEGLADNNIHCILQDSRGFMWFGSEEGLHRYDGYNMKVYRRGDDGSGISNNFIRALYEDKFGRLWIGTDRGGITIFDLDTETFQYVRYNQNDDTEGLLSDEVYCFSGSKDGNLWVGTKAGLSYLELNSDEDSKDIVVSFKHFRHNPDDPNSLSYPHVYSVLEDSEGILWAGTAEGGLSKLLPGANSFINYKPDDKNSKSISGLGIMTIYEDSKHNIWIGTWAKGLDLYNKENDSFVKFYHNKKDTTSLSHNNVYSVCEDQYNNLWIATYDGGINKLITGKKGDVQFQRYATQTSELMSFYKNRVKVIYADKSCSLWAGTLGNGITQISQMPEKFKQLTKESNNTKGLLDNNVNCIYPLSKDSALVGTKKGLQLLTWSPLMKPTLFRFQSILNDSYGTPKLRNTNITSAIRDSNGNYWIGTEKEGVYKFKLNGKSIVSFAHYSKGRKAPFSIVGNKIVRIVEHHNRMFVVSSNGISVFDNYKNRFVWRDENNELIFPITSSPKVIYFDSKERMYVGTHFEGVYVFSVSYENSVKVKKIGTVDINSTPINLSSNDILSISDGGENRVWVGTAKGIHLINIDDKTNKSYKEKDGLPSASVTQIFRDNKGYSWFATIQGLGRMDRVTNNISPFYIPGGFLSNYFSPAKIELINNSFVLLPSRKGILYFFPDRVQTNPFLAKPTITDFQISGQSVLPGVEVNNRVILNQSLDNTKEVVLKSNENIIKFEFSGLTFYKQNLNRYAYKLDGLESKWNYINANHRTVTYSNLSPKKYTFRVVAANSDGVWNPEETSLQIVIKPPFYKMWWAYMTYLLIILLAILIIPRFIINRIRLQENLKQEKIAREKETALNQMKLKFFTNISHEFRTPLSLISGPLDEILLEEEVKPPKIKSQLEMIKRNADRLMRLINQLMDFRKVMQGNMKLKIQKGLLTPYVTQVADSFMGAAVQKHIHFQTDIEEQDEICWFDHSKIETILFNLLSNAFKHTPKNGNILLELSYRDEYAYITVSDSGPGVKREDKDRIFDRFYQSQDNHDHGEAGTGIGLSLVKELAELHKGSISLSDDNESGASFKLEIGVSKQLFRDEDIIDDQIATDEVPVVQVEEETLTQIKDDGDEGNPLILVVEDNPDVMQYLKDILTPYFGVETASNGVKGMEKASAILPALIVSDVMMPEMDGFTFCKKVKDNFITSHIPVILLTALDGSESKVEGSEQDSASHEVAGAYRSIDK